MTRTLVSTRRISVSRLMVCHLSSWFALATLLIASFSFPAATIANCVQDAAGAEDDEGGWSDSLDAAIKKSRVSGQPVLVDFTAQWCAPCQLLKKEFQKPAFKNATEQVILVRVDVDRNEELATDFDVTSIPQLMLLDSNEEVIALKSGFAEADAWATWLKESLEGTEFEMPDVLTSIDPPTRTEIKELIETLGARDPALRQITMERLIAYPAKTRAPLIESLTEEGKLAQKLSVLEILKRWEAPIGGLDPWVSVTFSPEKMEGLNTWKETPLEELETVLKELTADDLKLAAEDMEALIQSRNVRAGLARMTRYGSLLLPAVYERIKTARTDDEASRLTALRYWLTASNELRLGWANGLIELASPELAGRRIAAQGLINRATLADQPLLLELFADSDPLVRELSLKGLQRIGAKETDATLARLLNDPDPNVRAAVLKSFADSESTQMLTAVAKYLETETDADLIVHALRFLRTGSGAQAISPVLQFVDHESWQVRAEAAEALGKIDSDDLDDVDLLVKKGDAVMKLLEDSDGFVVSRAVMSLPKKKNKKLLETMTQIAMRNPDIADAIVESISESARRYSYDNAQTSAPFLRKFLTHDKGQVRAAGLRGLVANYASELEDDEIAPLLSDEFEQVRIEALNGFYRRLDAFRSDQENVGSQSPIELEDQTGSAGGLLGIFGFGRPRLTKSKPEILTEPSVPTVDEPAHVDVKQASDLPPRPRSDEKPKSKPKPKKLKLPKLAEENWLQKWVDGKVKTEFDASTAVIKTLALSDNAQEKVRALACLVALGDHGRVNEMVEAADGDSDFDRLIYSTMKWLPFEDRTTLFKNIVSKNVVSKDDGDEMTSLMRAYTSVRNPESANLIWEYADHPAVTLRPALESLMAAYFSNSYSHYYSYGQADIEPDLMQLAKNETEQYLESKDPNRQRLVLLMLDKVDPEAAKKTAKTWVDSADDMSVRNLAFRVLLKPQTSRNSSDRFGNNSNKEDRSHAVEYLKTDEVWKFKTAIQYLALGTDALGESEYDTGLFRSSTNYYGSSSDVKVRIPKPPKGLTLELLSPDNLELDETTNAYVTYFRSLLDDSTDITNLLTKWRSDTTNEEFAKLVYEAVASTNNDDQIPVVEEIFEIHGINDNRFSSELYWTIRVMDGRNALKLRKVIRDKIGMSTLNQY